LLTWVRHCPSNFSNHRSKPSFVVLYSAETLKIITRTKQTLNPPTSAAFISAHEIHSHRRYPHVRRTRCLAGCRLQRFNCRFSRLDLLFPLVWSKSHSEILILRVYSTHIFGFFFGIFLIELLSPWNWLLLLIFCRHYCWLLQYLLIILASTVIHEADEGGEWSPVHEAW
jgi:hypothetical protein